MRVQKGCCLWETIGVAGQPCYCGRDGEVGTRLLTSETERVLQSRQQCSRVQLVAVVVRDACRVLNININIHAVNVCRCWREGMFRGKAPLRDV